MAQANPLNKWMIDPNDAVMLLIDHQSGLFQLVFLIWCRALAIERTL
jgi:hypothetical protein